MVSEKQVDMVSLSSTLFRDARVALVGGTGFVGEKLSSHFDFLKCTHCVLDINPSKHYYTSVYRTDYCVNLCNEDDIRAAFAEFRPTVVIHLASFGMSGPEMLDPRCYEINYGGTQNLMSACCRYNVKAVIYTSTYNVVFGGKEVTGDSDTPYFTGHHTDMYAPTKTLAEKLVLAYNGTPTEDGSPLVTCALRPAAIYGPGETRHFPRIVGVMDR